MQVVPHPGGVGAGFFADFLLLEGGEAGHGDVFAAEVGGAGLVMETRVRFLVLVWMDEFGAGNLGMWMELGGWWMIGWLVDTNDLNCSRFVFVCGPAAAVEGAEESVHLEVKEVGCWVICFRWRR